MNFSCYSHIATNGHAKKRRDLKVQNFPDPRRQIFDLGSKINRHSPKSKIWRASQKHKY